MKFPKCTLDAEYISSWQGLEKLVALGTGGGVFGIIARNNLHSTSDSGEALLWVAVFTWITTLFFYLHKAHGKSTLTSCGEYVYTLTVTIMYIITTILWGVYDTFPIASNRKGLIIFIFALVTTVSYLEQSISAIIEAYKKENCEKSADKNGAPANEAVIENGKEEEPAQKSVETST